MTEQVNNEQSSDKEVAKEYPNARFVPDQKVKFSAALLSLSPMYEGDEYREAVFVVDRVIEVEHDNLIECAYHIPCALCEVKGGSNILEGGGCRHRKEYPIEYKHRKEYEMYLAEAKAKLDRRNIRFRYYEYVIRQVNEGSQKRIVKMSEEHLRAFCTYDE